MNDQDWMDIRPVIIAIALIYGTLALLMWVMI